MKKVFRVGIAGAAIAVASAAQGWSDQITFTKDVLPILQENCQTCHRPSGANISGMIAPMSLMTYEEVRPWARSIVRAVQEGSMPPWHASEAQHGVFRNERTLSSEEIDTIVAWIEQRAPRGNPQDAPAEIAFPATGWNLGTPDMVLDFPEPYFVADEVEDLYHNITVQLSEEQFPETEWIKAIEFKPGSEVVHHIIGYASGDQPDDTDTEEGSDVGGRTMLGGNAPGTEHADYPAGFGIELAPKSFVTFAMHYHKESGPGTGVWDSSQIGFKFAEEEVTHPIDISAVAHGAMEIPPLVNNWRVGASHTFTEDTWLLSLMPHMHLRGKAATYTAFYPDGTSERLLDVPTYDFNWQTQYEFTEMKQLPAGTRLQMELFYDNSAEKAAAIGFNPNRPVRFGGPTTDEMDLAWFTVAPVEPVNLSANADATQSSGD
jgi:mono/diheme cytochrome c family protein